MGSFVIARGDGAKLFESAKEVLDQMAGLVKVPDIVARSLSIAFGRYDRRLGGFAERFDHPLVGVDGGVDLDAQSASASPDRSRMTYSP